MKFFSVFTFISILAVSSCSNDDAPGPSSNELYFPSPTTWETTGSNELEWNQEALEELLTFLDENNSRAFIILKDGKIVMEEYWGLNALETGPFNASSAWYWASAGKTLTALLAGIAQQEGDLDLNLPTINYLGTGWTSMDPSLEANITVWNQLTMTTGLDYNVTDLDCTDPECLTYNAPPGEEWYYHNAPYTLLEQVISQATETDYNTYTDEKVESITGMNGVWLPSGFNNVYWSTPRDAARFGLLLLNEGIWEDVPVLNESDFFNSIVNSSQKLNPSYGYLTWLNGKSSFISPGLPLSINSSISPNAPAGLYAALGRNGQFIDVVPSKNLVVVRMGDNPENTLIPITFHDSMWEKLMAVIE